MLYTRLSPKMNTPINICIQATMTTIIFIQPDLKWQFKPSFNIHKPKCKERRKTIEFRLHTSEYKPHSTQTAVLFTTRSI